MEGYQHVKENFNGEEYKRNGNGWYDYIMNNADQSIKDAFNEYL